MEEANRLGQIGEHGNFVDNTITTSRYKMYNFVFLNLKEQFRRKANIYFLVISILMILGWYFPRLFQSSINPWGTLGTLIFVLGVTMVKDGVEDRNRHLADRRENSSIVRVLRNGQQELIEKRDVRVGDYVVVKNREQFPADLILFLSSDERGQCFVETANIDGETNLKIRKAPQLLADSGVVSEETLPRSGSFECDPPNKKIHNFSATLKINDVYIPAGVSNFLLRGSVLRNTSWIIGLVVYTGEDTKIMKNLGEVPSKLSNIERTVNKLIVFVFISQFTLVLISVLVNVGYVNKYNYAYLGNQDSFILPYWLGNFFTFYILYSNFVPISLYVTLEMVNLIQSVFIEMDVEMYHEEEDVKALCRNSTLCQEIGQVEYIFSDKTGTLTQNLMEFKLASINGAVYDANAAERAVANRDPEALEFFRLLSVCHTVVPDEEGEKLDLAGIQCPPYEAESPDEGALVEAAARAGVRFFDRTQDEIEVREFDPNALETRRYKVLAVNEFNSTRKRMSVLVQVPSSGEYVLYCKGADNIMFDLCDLTDTIAVEKINSHLTTFAEDGLRTLVCAKKILPEADALAWLAKFKQAELTVENRAQAMEDVAALVEVDMTIVGASAIEDKLQDQVPETLEDLQKAGIKVWVLTGDKLETAVNIGYSCRLLNPTMRVVTISTDTKEEAAEQIRRLENVISITEDVSLLRRFRVGVSQLKQSVVDRVLPASMRAKSLSKKDSESSEDVAAASDLAQTLVEDSRRRKTAARNEAKHSNSVRITRSASDSADGIMMREMDSSGDIETGTKISMVQREVDSGFFDSIGKNSVNSPAAGGDDSDDSSTESDAVGSTDHLALVIDGKTLHFVMEDKALRKAFLHVGRVCKAVIACRVSPAQKAEVVTLVKKGIKSRPITLAIGDGANDVTMIQQAHLGVGVSGREGRAAVNSSDFAIGQFRFLRKLLLVHGRSNYRRMCKVILLCFYKNIMLVCTLFIYSFWSLMSGTSPYDSWIYSGYNWFSGMPPVLLGAFDLDMSPSFLMALPVMYVSGRTSMYLNEKEILKWILRAAAHSIVCALIPIYVGLTLGLPSNLTYLYSFGNMMFTGVLFTVLLIIGLETRTWNGFHWFFYPGSIALYFVAIAALSWLPGYTPMTGVSENLFPEAMMWALGVFLIPLANYTLELFFKYARLQLWPSIVDLGAEVSNGKSAYSVPQFRKEVETILFPMQVSPRDIDDVIESTYPKQESSRTLAPRVARTASSAILFASE